MLLLSSKSGVPAAAVCFAVPLAAAKCSRLASLPLTGSVGSNSQPCLALGRLARLGALRAGAGACLVEVRFGARLQRGRDLPEG